MNEACSNTQTTLYTKATLTDSDNTHIAECCDCQDLQRALDTVDAAFMTPERRAPARFAALMASRVLERTAHKKKLVKVTAGAVCLVLMIAALRLILPPVSIIYGLLVAIGGIVLARKATNYRRWIALGATCCLAVIVVSGGLEHPMYRRRLMAPSRMISEASYSPSPGFAGLGEPQMAGSSINLPAAVGDEIAPYQRDAELITGFNGNAAKQKSDSIRLQQENKKERKSLDEIERQVGQVFQKKLNSLTETEQRNLAEGIKSSETYPSVAADKGVSADEVIEDFNSEIDQLKANRLPLERERLTETDSSIGRARTFDRAAGLGGAKEQSSFRSGKPSLADSRINLPAPREEATDDGYLSARSDRANHLIDQVSVSKKAGNLAAPVQHKEGFRSLPASGAVQPLSSSTPKAKDAGRDLTNKLGNAAPAYNNFSNPSAGKIISAQIADTPRRQKIPYQEANQKDARLKKELATDSTIQPANEIKTEEDYARSVDAFGSLAGDDAPSPQSKLDADKKNVPVVTYLDPNGYWENTYLPGSPAVPLLFESLHKTIFPQVPMEQIRNTSSVLMVQHPVDAPLQGALGLAAHTDLPYLDKPSRVLLQVTINSADRAKGNRPPLTIVVVLPDSKNIPAHEQKIIQDTLRALEAERRVDDHIAVLTDETNIPVPFSEFRYGTLELFLKKLQQVNATETLPDGKSALYRTASALAFGDDSSQLRERIILTVGHSGTTSFEPAYPELDSHVLQGGVASVLAITDNIDLMRLSARGQGSYRVMNPSLPAEDQIRAELESFGAVVARALRLNVQLQPGVKLKEIIGSNKLSAPEVEREKAIEVATDKRIAQSLGIEADRGNDDPGIQILIPRFMSGDSHIFILDLFVEKAGHIADVSLKSKDLVLMRNETLHASAALPAYRDDAGQINSIIAHNEYAQRLATVIRMVRKFAEYGDLSNGVALLQSYARDLETYAPPSNEKTSTANLINNYISFLQAMIASNQQGNSNDVREAVTTSLDMTSDTILGNSVRRNK